MSQSFIVDASVALTWLFQDEITPATTGLLRRLESEATLVPSLWHLEITNALAVAQRRGRATAAQVDEFAALVQTLRIEVDLESHLGAFSEIPAICRNQGLSSYDAAHLELAVRRKLPLASLGEPLRNGAKKLAVKIARKIASLESPPTLVGLALHCRSQRS